MLALTIPRAASTLLEEVDTCRELVLIAASPASRLDEEFDRESDDALLVVIDALTELSEASTLDDESERLFELAFMVLSAASTLDEELERLRLEV